MDRTLAHPSLAHRRHPRTPDATRWTTFAARRHRRDTPEESDMTMMDVGAIGGAIVVLALLGFIVFKFSFKH
jgi:hypothetical protein